MLDTRTSLLPEADVLAMSGWPLCLPSAAAFGVRATEVVYNRACSAFAEAPASAWDWPILLDGVDRLHLSGITPALGLVPAESAVSAAVASTARGIPVSFDGNWRGKLWERWDSRPRDVLTCLVRHADLLFGNHRDIACCSAATFQAARRHAAEKRRGGVCRVPQASDHCLDEPYRRACQCA